MFGIVLMGFLIPISYQFLCFFDGISLTNKKKWFTFFKQKIPLFGWNAASYVLFVKKIWTILDDMSKKIFQIGDFTCPLYKPVALRISRYPDIQGVAMNPKALTCPIEDSISNDLLDISSKQAKA